MTVAFSKKLKASEGWLTQQEAATNLGISPMSLNRLIQAEIIAAEGAAGFPRAGASDRGPSSPERQAGSATADDERVA